jgi:hypothetical protein
MFVLMPFNNASHASNLNKQSNSKKINNKPSHRLQRSASDVSSKMKDQIDVIDSSNVISCSPDPAAVSPSPATRNRKLFKMPSSPVEQTSSSVRPKDPVVRESKSFYATARRKLSNAGLPIAGTKVSAPSLFGDLLRISPPEDSHRHNQNHALRKISEPNYVSSSRSVSAQSSVEDGEKPWDYGYEDG